MQKVRLAASGLPVRGFLLPAVCDCPWFSGTEQKLEITCLREERI